MRKFLFPGIHGLDHDLCIRFIINPVTFRVGKTRKIRRLISFGRALIKSEHK